MGPKTFWTNSFALELGKKAWKMKGPGILAPTECSVKTLPSLVMPSSFITPPQPSFCWYCPGMLSPNFLASESDGHFSVQWSIIIICYSLLCKVPEIMKSSTSGFSSSMPPFFWPHHRYLFMLLILQIFIFFRVHPYSYCSLEFTSMTSNNLLT